MYILKLSGPPIRESSCLSSYPDCSNHFPVFLNAHRFLFRHYGFDFKFCSGLFRWPSSNSHPFRSHFCSSHFLAISEFKSCPILIILSPVSTFIFSKRVKILARANSKFFRLSLKSSFSIWCLILFTICAIRSKAPSVSSSNFRSLKLIV